MEHIHTGLKTRWSLSANCWLADLQRKVHFRKWFSDLDFWTHHLENSSGSCGYGNE